MNVLLVHLKGVPEVALVLAERFAVIAVDDPQRVLLPSADLEAVDQCAERGVGVVQRIAVAADFVAIREWTRLRRIVRMVSRSR